MHAPDFIAHEAAPPPTPKGAPRPWWEGRPFVAAMIALAFVPLLYPAIPPLVDLPGHMGRYAVAAGLPDRAMLERFFTFQWRPIGNLGVDLLVVPLAGWLGVELATKLVVMAIPPLTVAGFLWVAREVHNRLPPTAAFVLPFAFAQPFLYGFVNYSLSMALAFLGFALWMRLYRARRFGLRALIFVPLSFLVFLCHTFGWGTLGLLAFSGEAVREHDRGLPWWRAGISAALHAAVLAGPLALLLFWRGDASGGRTFGWFLWSRKWEYAVGALRNQWEWLDKGALALLAALLVYVIVHRTLAISRNLAFSALVLFGCYLVLPYTIFGSAYADMRLVPYAFALLVLSIRFEGAMEPLLARRLAWGGLAFVAVMIGATTWSLARAARAQTAILGALDHVRPGSRVAAFAEFGCRQWALPRNTHLMSMAIVRRGAFANDQWRMAGSSLLTVHFPEAKRFSNDPSQIVQSGPCRKREWTSLGHRLARLPAGQFDYVWLIDPLRFPTDDHYRKIWRGPGAILYAIDRSAVPPETPGGAMPAPPIPSPSPSLPR